MNLRSLQREAAEIERKIAYAETEKGMIELSSFEVQGLDDRLLQVKEQIEELRMFHSFGIGERYLNAKLSDFDNGSVKALRYKNSSILQSLSNADFPQAHGAESIVIPAYFGDYLKGMPDQFDSGRSFIISGVQGAGKTHLVIAIAIEMHRMFRAQFRKTLSVKYILMSDLAAAFRDRSFTAEEKIQNIRNQDILIVDDMSAENTWDNIIDDINVRIFRHRYNSLLPTFITTNAAMHEFSKLYGPRSSSIFFGESYSSISLYREQDIRLEMCDGTT